MPVRDSEVAELERRMAELYPSRRARRPRAQGCVYFIQEGDNGPIKIGWAVSISARLAALQIGNPRELRVLAFVETRRRRLEAEIHERFATDRLGGEWFSPSEALISYITSLTGSPDA